MGNEHQNVVPSRGPLAVLALAIGALTILVVVGLAVLVAGRAPPVDEVPIFLILILVVSAPFLLLALLNVRSGSPWVTGIALTALFWGLLLIDGIARAGDGSGANIGLGIIMLLSPIIISAFCLFVVRQNERSGEDQNRVG